MSLAAEPESLALMNIESAHQKSDTTNTMTDLPKRGWRRAGILFGLLAGICMSFVKLANKALTEKNYHPLNIAFWTCQANALFTPLFILYLLIVKKKNIFESIAKEKAKLTFLIVARGVVAFIGMITFLNSLGYLTVADATVILASRPIVVTLFARICLGEPCGVIPVISAMVVFSGVVVLARPPILTGADKFNTETLIGIGWAVASTVTYSIAYVVIRGLRKIHFSLLLLSFGYVTSIMALISSLMMGVFEIPRSGDDWIMIMIGCAVTVLVGQTLLSLALKFEEAGPMALVRTFDIVFAFILQLIFFGLYPDAFSIIGASIVAFGVIVITFRKWLSTVSEDHPSRVWCSFILK